MKHHLRRPRGNGAGQGLTYDAGLAGTASRYRCHRVFQNARWRRAHSAALSALRIAWIDDHLLSFPKDLTHGFGYRVSVHPERQTSMAQKVHITLEDDLDGGDATEPVAFGLDGRSYEIDLNDKNAKTLRDSLATYVAAARRSGNRASRAKGRTQM